jgi:hypothetical protein
LFDDGSVRGDFGVRWRQGRVLGGVEVFTAFCESHTSQVPFHAAVGLLARWPAD